MLSDLGVTETRQGEEEWRPSGQVEVDVMTHLLRDGDRVAFLGDSLTQDGWDKPRGWVRLVLAAHTRHGIALDPVPAGIGGHRSVDMLARLQHDVLDRQPDWMLLSCGVNDVWHGDAGVTLADFERHVDEILDRAGAAGVRSVVLTATIIGEDPRAEANATLAGYNRVQQDAAAGRGLTLIDANAEFQLAVASGPGTGSHLTDDGVHFNLRGEEVMARSVLAGLGFSPSELEAL